MLKKFLQEDKGAMGSFMLLIFLGGIFLVLGITSLTLENYRINYVKAAVRDEVVRGMNIAITEGMEDIYRKDEVSKIDPDKVDDAFFGYIKEELNLNSTLEQKDGAYFLNIDTFDVQEEPPKIYLNGDIKLKSSFLKEYYFTIPIRAVKRNDRAVDANVNENLTGWY